MQQLNINKVAVIGCGHWGKGLVKNFAALGALAAISDPHEATAQKFAAEYGVRALPWDAILKDTTISGIVIAAPAVLHANLALEALEAGKHVYVEKPLALTIADADDLIARARQKKRILMVGHLLQYHPVFVRMRQLVAEGTLGQLRHLYSNRLSLGKIRHEEDVLWSFAPHDISMILALATEIPSRVQAASSHGLQNGIADTAHLHLDFSSGLDAHIHVSWLHPFKEQRLVAIGDKAMAVFEDTKPWDEKLLLYPHGINPAQSPPLLTKQEAVAIDVSEDEPLRCECRHFLDCMATGQQPLTDGEEGLRVLRVLAQASAQLNKK